MMAIHADRDPFVEDLKSRLDDWDAEYSKLKAKANKTATDDKLRCLEELERMRRQRQQVQAQLYRVKTASRNARGRSFLIGVLEWASIKSTLEIVKSRLER